MINPTIVELLSTGDEWDREKQREDSQRLNQASAAQPSCRMWLEMGMTALRGMLTPMGKRWKEAQFPLGGQPRGQTQRQRRNARCTRES
jgi:hypothetical protein